MIASYVFLFNGLAFLSLGALLASSWGEKGFPRVLLWPCGATIIWSVANLMAISSADAQLLPPYLFLIDFVKTGAWFILLSRLLVTLGMRKRFEIAAHFAWVGATVATIALMFAGTTELVAIASAIKLTLAIIGLVLVEQLFRNTPLPGRWSVKYICFAAGAVFVYELDVAVETLIDGAMDPALAIAGGYVNLVVFALYAIGALRSSSWPGGIQLSHSMVFGATAVVAVSLYLFVVALGTYFIDQYGGTLEPAMQVTFLISAIAVLLMLLFSDTIRARFRVFVAKNFQRYKYDYRSEWLRFTQKVSAAAGEETVTETSIQALADIVGSHGGAMWVASESGSPYELKAVTSQGLQLPDMFAYGDSLPDFCRRYGWVIDLHEFRDDAQSYKTLSLPDQLLANQKAWLIVPLLLGDVLVGFIVLENPPVVPELNFEDRDLLKTVGRAIATYVSQFEASLRLAEHQQFGAFHRLSAFLMHDLKNVISQLSLVVKNAETHRHNPEFIDDAISTLTQSVERMNKMIRQFGSGANTGRLLNTPLRPLVETAVGRCKLRCPKPELKMDEHDVFIEADAEKLVSVFEHIVSNAQEATPDDGQISIELRRVENGIAVLSVRDSGIGMSDEFIRQRLFKPFDSTKGQTGLGIGAYQAREYVRSLGGEIRVRSEEGRGSVFEIRLPVNKRTPAQRAEV